MYPRQGGQRPGLGGRSGGKITGIGHRNWINHDHGCKKHGRSDSGGCTARGPQRHFFDKSFTEISKDNEYRAGEELGGGGYLNPAGVYAGASGKFYVYDLYDKQIVVYTSEGSREKTIPLVSDALSGELALLHAGCFPMRPINALF